MGICLGQARWNVPGVRGNFNRLNLVFLQHGGKFIGFTLDGILPQANAEGFTLAGCQPMCLRHFPIGEDVLANVRKRHFGCFLPSVRCFISGFGRGGFIFGLVGIEIGNHLLLGRIGHFIEVGICTELKSRHQEGFRNFIAFRVFPVELLKGLVGGFNRGIEVLIGKMGQLHGVIGFPLDKILLEFERQGIVRTPKGFADFPNPVILAHNDSDGFLAVTGTGFNGIHHPVVGLCGKLPGPGIAEEQQGTDVFG